MLRPDEGILARFTRDLTAEARAGRLEPVRAREAEVARVVDILLRHGKNNPVLLGPAGVGKTAIVEGLAQHVATGDVALSLRGARILALDHVSLLAGTMYRGQYEERLRGLVAEVAAAGDAILFVDELHNLIGQGTAMGAAMDAANMLKPALVRGDFRVIGATTDEEYDRWIRGDPALERRFQAVRVRELGSEETLEILRARQPGLERHHHVVIGDDALVAAVRLTDLLVTDRRRPDRAIDALDEACAHAHAVTRYSPRAEALIARRRALASVRGARSEATVEDSAPAGATVGEEAADDPLERFAREGFQALERFGAELEAMLGMPAEAPPGGARRQWAGSGGERANDRAPRAAPDAPAAAPSSLAEVEAQLRRQLIDDGVVVRGHDVARVVGLMTGTTVQWVE